MRLVSLWYFIAKWKYDVSKHAHDNNSSKLYALTSVLNRTKIVSDFENKIQKHYGSIDTQFSITILNEICQIKA
ncbi:hypothetical protein BpHYR1_050025 [Brachionus plicatilis]|uniref:Uncharacterized protein n=1 Tax=Brachionus plicatilis TaxID=10195 RepID=A0A3M7S1M3_BRAPC|nr:hypothetical protein BpHYR1_050025 [Brachionus plicatilis]